MMESNKGTKTKALIFSIFVHSTMLLAIGMAGFEAVKVMMPESEMEILPPPQGGQTQEVEILDAPSAVAEQNPVELPKALSEKAKPNDIVEPVENPAPKLKAKAVAKQPPVVLPAKNESPANKAEPDTVEESPVAVAAPAAEETNLEEKQLEDADESAKTAAEPPGSETVENNTAEEEIETSDPQEKFAPAPPQKEAKTEAAAPAVPDDGEDWTKELKAAALPSAQASEPPAANPGSANSRFQQGNVRSESELTPKKGNPQAIYPQIERLKRVEGTAVIRFNVDSNGNVSNAWLHSSSGSKAIDAEALRTQKAWKYQPGLHGTFQKPWVFRLKGNPEEMPYRIR